DLERRRRGTLADPREGFLTHLQGSTDDWSLTISDTNRGGLKKFGFPQRKDTYKEPLSKVLPPKSSALSK
ncbi:hypothetical protein Nmel_014931, partial [Mimus melanotis]